jgi:phosphinothricin acetyltransferase
MDVITRTLREGDWARVADIYGQGIRSGDATFETDVPSWSEWSEAKLPVCRLVAEVNGRVVGFAAVSPVSSRPVYAGVAEVMVYVDEGVRGRGVGRLLLEALVRCAEAADLWTLQAGIFPENAASIAVHRAVGFEVMGTHERLGRFHDGRWRDVVRMERRSDRAGTR